MRTHLSISPSLLLLMLLTACNPGPTTSGGGVSSEKTIDVDVEVIDLPQRYYLVLRQELPLDNMTGFFGIEGPALLAAARAAEIEPIGPLSGLFYTWDTEAGYGDAAVALPVAPGTTLAGYVGITLPAGRAFAAPLDGPYPGLGAIHYALGAQFQLEDVRPATPSIEEYLVGPADGAEEADFKTRVIYPIAE